MRRNIISSNPTRTQLIVYCALFIALGVVLKLLFEIYIPLGGFPSLRINLTMIPIFLSGIILGPIPGFIVGVCSDLLCYVIKPNGPLFLGFTITNGMVGLIPGYLWLLLRGRNVTAFRWINLVITFIVITYLLTGGFLTFNGWNASFNGNPINSFLIILILAIILLYAFFPFISPLIFGKDKGEFEDKILFIVTVEQVVDSIIFNSLWLSFLYGQALNVLLPARVITNIFIIPFYTIIIVFLIRIFMPGLFPNRSVKQ